MKGEEKRENLDIRRRNEQTASFSHNSFFLYPHFRFWELHYNGAHGIPYFLGWSLELVFLNYVAMRVNEATLFGGRISGAGDILYSSWF